MSRILNLIKNLKCISKMDLRKNRLMWLKTEELLENMLYYVPNSSVIRPNVLDGDQTIDVLCKSNKSLARFGDGEILIISGKDIPFQQYDEKLAKRMREILLNNNSNLMVGINHWYFFPKYDPAANELSRNFTLFSMPQARKTLIGYLDLSKDYYDAGFTTIRYEKNSENDKFFKKIRTIWNKHEIVLVGCREAHQKMQYDLFDNASKENWIYVPNVNAFSEYDTILKKIKSYSKDTIVILMAGPTSKVLAYDLSKVGYRALDLGHVAKSYDYYMRSVIFNSETEEEFWKPDL